MTITVVWLVLGLGVGIGVAFGLRRLLPAWRTRRHVAKPPVYASRQEGRKAKREQQKRKRR